LDSDGISPLHVIGLPFESGSPTNSEWVLDNFRISADGTKLAVISRGTDWMCGDHSTFRLFDLPSADLLYLWRFAGCPEGLSLSEDGKHVMFDSGDLLDTATGRLVRKFTGGGGVFVDSTRFLRPTPLPDKGPQALEIVNTETGQVDHQFHYSKYGVSTGRVDVAPAAGVIAVMDMWFNPKDLARDATYARGFTRLIMFHMNDDQPFYASPDVKDPPSSSDDGYVARLSSDGRVVAYGGRIIHVVRVAFDKE
jgi:hypothetical protein